MRYASQYSGRRPEAAHERLVALIELMCRARYQHTFEQRFDRLQQVLDTLDWRELAWLHRFTAHEPKWMSRAAQLNFVAPTPPSAPAE